MNFSDPRFWLDLAHWLILIAVAVITWLRRPGEEAGKAVAKLRAQMEANHTANQLEAATLRERIAHMPTNEELADVAGSVKSLASGQERMGIQLNRIEQYLLNQK